MGFWMKAHFFIFNILIPRGLEYFNVFVLKY